MKGRTQAITLGDTSFTMARATFHEMPDVIDRYDAGEVEGLLLEAAGEHAEDLRAALEQADHEDVTAFLGAWHDFAGIEKYRKNYLEPRAQKNLEAQALMFRTMKDQGLITETYLEDLMNQQIDTLPSGTTTTGLPTAGRPLS